MAEAPELVKKASKLSETLFAALDKGLFPPEQYLKLSREGLIMPLASYYLEGLGAPENRLKFVWNPPAGLDELAEIAGVNLNALTAVALTCHRVFQVAMSGRGTIEDMKFGVLCLELGKRFCKVSHHIADTPALAIVKDEFSKNANYFEALFALESAKLIKDKDLVADAVFRCKRHGDEEMIAEADLLAAEVMA